MATLFGRNWTRKQLLDRVGDPSQLAFARPCTLADGKAKGVSAVEFNTGGGLRFTVLPDRGLDICSADFNGRSLCWRSATGDVSPAFYQPEGAEWLRGFFGGLLTTCGLTYFGGPCVDEGEQLGVHGRVSNIPAQEVSVSSGWEGDEYLIGIRGKVVESSVFGPCLCLTRAIFTTLGRGSLLIHDEVTNIGHSPAPHMMLYHINLGFPVVDKGARLIAPSLSVTPSTPHAAEGKSDYGAFDAPTAGCKEKVYFHRLAAAGNRTVAGVANPALNFGAYVAFDTRNLPFLIEWKMMRKGEYVVGVEPSTNLTTDRARERAEGRLRMLKPGETVRYDMEIGALPDARAIAALEAQARKLMGRNRTRIA